MLKRIFQKPKIKKDSINNDDKVTLAKIDTDESRENEEQELFSTISEISGISVYEGHVEHGYSIDNVSTTQECPKCHSPAQKYYANWIYATQIAPRVMFASAGYFCSKCPTVIVDESLIKSAIKKRFQFQGILGIDYGEKKEPDLFKTWNGEETVYIFDENETAMGLSTIGSIDPVPSKERNKTTKERRKKIARQSRKRNRRRK